MEEHTCPHCDMVCPPNDEGRCPLCGRDANAVPEATEPETETPSATMPGEPLPTVTAMPTPEVPAAASVTPPPPMPTAELADGQTRCPHCGEALYSGEQSCWSCSKRVDEPRAESAPAAVPPAPVAMPALPCPGPVTAAPEPPPAVGWDELPRAEDKPAPDAETMRLSYWSLGLGMAALLSCGVLSILAPIGLWLGVKARREGGDTVATVGFVAGIVGTVVFVIVAVFVFLLIVGVIAGQSFEAIAPLN